jgi:hypothetical protein
MSDHAFYNCYSLTTADFASCTIISDMAFMYCSDLSIISFPECSIIGISAFTGCYNITVADFPECSIIKSYAFTSCSNITMASFPNCASIESYAFHWCSSLSSLYLMGSSVPYLFSWTVFAGTPFNSNLGTIYVPSSLYNDYIVASGWSAFSLRIVSV